MDDGAASKPRAHDASPDTATPPSGETTVEELSQFVTLMATNEPHVRCRAGDGPLAPLAVALNGLASLLETRRLSAPEKFGIEALVEQSQNMMLTCDTSERIRFVNFTVPGLTFEQVVGRSIYDFVLPADQERVRAIIRQVLETGVPSGYDIQSATPTGPQWYVVRVGPIRDKGQVVGFTTITTDVTDLKQTQNQLERSLRELERSNRELESFASVASHDLQEPLRKIQAFGERLEAMHGLALGPEGSDYLARMQKAATRMRRLIDDLLSFSRVMTLARPFVPVELATVTREVLGDLEVSIDKAGATVSVDELPTIEADPMQMRQLLQNLLGNAIKFRHENVPPRVSVRATVDEASGTCELRVEDNGIGFEERLLDRLFNVFQRLHGHGRYEGTGMGLAICRKIAERHGGSITARSTPGQGTVFIVTLPLTHPQK